jgi:hypothetical protein
MVRTPLRPPNTLVFHGFLPWFLAKITALLILGAKFLELAGRSGSFWWLAGLGFCAGAATLLCLQYDTEVIIVHEAALVCRRGALNARETTMPLWPLTLDISHGLLGRIFNYGTVRLRFDDTTIQLRSIAPVRLLRTVIAQRQAEILLSRQNGQVVSRGRDRAHAT